MSDTLGMRGVARLANIGSLLVFFLLSLIILTRNFPYSVVYFYILPVVLILSGYALNFLWDLNFDSLRSANKFLPWLASLSIPFYIYFNPKTSWQIFYFFMLSTSVVSLSEYAAIFFGVLSPSLIETDRGVFLKGFVSILHSLEGDIPYYRFYGVFGEPGTTAMLLLPALSFALVFEKKLAAAVFLLAILLTDSLGGFFGLAIMLSLFCYWKVETSKTSGETKVLLGFIFAISVVVFSIFVADYFSSRYEQKNLSAEVRENNMASFFENFGSILVEHPTGLQLGGESMSSLVESKESYLGSNFMFYLAFVYGGALSFLGYSIFFMILVFYSIKFFYVGIYTDKVVVCAFISLLPLLTFCFQRTTILESSLFAFLFSGPLLSVMASHSSLQSGYFVWMRRDGN